MKMAFAQDTRNKLFAGALSIGLAFGAAAPALANDVQNNNANVETIVPKQQKFASLSSEEAQELSKNRILLHFGSGFPEETKNGIIEALTDLNYIFTVADEGGPEGMLDLYINGQKGKQPFNPSEAVTYLGYVLQKNASEFKLTQPDSTPELDTD